MTLDAQVSPPFLVHGAPVQALFPDDCHPARVAELDATIDRNTQRRPVAQTLAALDSHDQAILDHMSELGTEKPARETERARVQPAPERSPR